MKAEKLLSGLARLSAGGAVEARKLLDAMDLIMDRGLVAGDLSDAQVKALLGELDIHIEIEDILTAHE